MGIEGAPAARARCARIPRAALAGLGALRRAAGVEVAVGGGSAWIWWDRVDPAVLMAVLPIAGAELFEGRGGAWYRVGRHLPEAGVPDRAGAVPVARAVWPAPIDPGGSTGLEAWPGAIPIRLERGGRPRPASALIAPLAAVARWAEEATAAEIEAVRGSIGGDRALLVGGDLPALAGADRYWGDRVLMPMGFEARPDVGEAALLEVIGAGDGSVVRLGRGDDGGVVSEVIPGSAFATLTRAGVRLAGGAWPR